MKESSEKFMVMRVLVVFSVFISGLTLGFFLDRSGWTPSKDDKQQQDNLSAQVREAGGYRFINPLLECEISGNSLDSKRENFGEELTTVAEKTKEEYDLTDIAVYFRDLNNGPTFGFNEEREFFPASLLKVPIMMTLLSLSEKDPSILSKKVTYNESRDLGVLQFVPPKKELMLKETYTVDELIRRMIVYSDNQAAALLLGSLPKEKMEELFRMLGVGEETPSWERVSLTVKEYASFFRILFNSSYLSRENSEKALRLLSEVEYRNALPVGIPDGIAVAHKFGEAGTGGDIRQLHDCGIVYFPNHPYLLCIMTRGYKAESLEKAIVDISRFVYGKVDNQY